MSTLQVINAKHPSSASNNLVLDASGNATFAGTVTTAGMVVPSSSFLRNRIINGGMEIAQRATTATGAYTSVFVYASVDRWAVYSANSSTTQAQSSDVPSGFRNSFRVQRPSGNTGTNSLIFVQGIESSNCYDLSGQAVTLSFWAKRGANYSGGNLSVSLVTGTTADQSIALIDTWAGRATPISSTAAITTTWTRYTFTGTVGAGILEAAALFSWVPSGTAGADDSVYITGVQLEVGTAATPFERRQFGQELALCQRYFQWVPFSMGFSAAVGGYVMQTQVPFQVQMRAVPSFAALSTDPSSTPLVVNNFLNNFNGTYSSVNQGFASLVATAAGTCQVLGYRSAASAEL